MKFSIPEIRSKVTQILEKRQVVQEQIQKIVIDLEKELNAVGEPEPAEPSEKKQFVVLLGEAGDDGECAAWILQMPETASVYTLNDLVAKAIFQFNTTKRGRKHPAKSMAEGLEVVGGKFFKEQKVVVKTKLPVAGLRLRDLPTEATEKVAAA